MIIWREKRVMLIVAGSLLLANLLFFFTYRVQYQQRVDDMRGRLEQARSQLDSAKEKRVDLEGQLVAHDKLVSTIDKVFEEGWSTPEERLTRVVVEVQSLGEKSGLVPRSFNFNRQEDRARLGTTTMGITFNVEGTYAQTRQLINLIELSNEFLIIDSIALRNSNENRLSLSVALKTLFRGELLPLPATTVTGGGA
jgi:Tfp pilus assembly protein PilO